MAGKRKIHALTRLVTGLALASALVLSPLAQDEAAADSSLDSYGCGANPARSLTVIAGTPAIGTKLTLGIDNPHGTQAIGSIPFLYLALRADPWFPCGKLLPGFGQGGPGSSGELLIDLSSVFMRLTGAPWKGVGEPVPFEISIPSDPSLVGMEFRAQGVLIDLSAQEGVRFGLTEALHGRIGS